jgi:thymidylate synthase (FAD)
LPAEKDVNEQSETNNQGRGKELDEDNKILVLSRMVNVTDQAKECYRQIVDPTPYDGFYEKFKGIARELARTVLPVSNYTECIWKIDLNNFFHFAKLRMDPHAQQEIQDYAKAMYELVKPKFPICCEAFEDYILDARTFSAKEMRIIKDNLNGSWVMSKYGLSNRESKEFFEKLKGA